MLIYDYVLPLQQGICPRMVNELMKSVLLVYNFQSLCRNLPQSIKVLTHDARVKRISVIFGRTLLSVVYSMQMHGLSQINVCWVTTISPSNCIIMQLDLLGHI